MPEPVKLEIRYSPLGDYVRFRLLSNGILVGGGVGGGMVLRSDVFAAFRAACPGLEFVEDERREVGKR